jgi:hypothetical protein
MVGETTEEQTILHVQNLDFIYSQSGTLYDIIPNALRPLKNARKKNPEPHADGVVGSISHASVNQLANQMVQMYIKPCFGTNAQTVAVPTHNSKVNLV